MVDQVQFTFSSPQLCFFSSRKVTRGHWQSDSLILLTQKKVFNCFCVINATNNDSQACYMCQILCACVFVSLVSMQPSNKKNFDVNIIIVFFLSFLVLLCTATLWRYCLKLSVRKTQFFSFSSQYFCSRITLFGRYIGNEREQEEVKKRKIKMLWSFYWKSKER